MISSANSAPLGLNSAASPPLQASVDVERLLSSTTQTQEEKLGVLAHEFEKTLFRQMFRTVQKSSFGEGFLAESGSTSQYSEIALQHLSDTLAETADLGIASSLQAQLIMAHKAQSSPASPES